LRFSVPSFLLMERDRPLVGAVPGEIELSRYPRDHPRTRFALILASWDGCRKVLSREPMLRASIYRRVRRAALDAERVCELIGAAHPICTAAERELLTLVDDRFATAATRGTGRHLLTPWRCRRSAR
jgi:hypothetical protein